MPLNTIRIVCYYGFDRGVVRVDVDLRIQHRGNTFQAFANNGFSEILPTDPELLRQFGSILRLNSSGVDKIAVTPFSLEMQVSRAISVDDVARLMEQAALRAGFKPIMEIDRGVQRLH